MTFKLLSTANTKILKSKNQGFITYGLHLAPVDLCGVGNTCPRATPGCKAACLNSAGRGQMNSVQTARIRKTVRFFKDRAAFMRDLVADVEKAINQARRLGLQPCFRLNLTSDIAWEKYPVYRNDIEYINIFAAFAEFTFYDYTKVLGRRGYNIPNYHLTFSAADGNDQDVLDAIEQGYNVAVVFDRLPPTFLSRPVIDGDVTDLRFLDRRLSVVGLVAKGKAKKDTTGFVRRANVQFTPVLDKAA